MIKCSRCGKEIEEKEAWIPVEEYWKQKYPNETIQKRYCPECGKEINSKIR